MILAAPYYDPDGTYNACFQKHLDQLFSMFDAICLCVIAPTDTQNAKFLKKLKQAGCTVVSPSADSFGQPSRDALLCAANLPSTSSPVFFGFLDRLLFVLDTEWRSSFLSDLRTYQDANFCIFERSPRDWETHPSNYRNVEQMVTQIGQLLWGICIEWTPGALLLSQSTVQMLLEHSISPSFAVWSEWILLAMTQQILLTRKQVDWLAWEDPYWEHIEAQTLKHRRETSQEETRKRIAWNTSILQLFTEERFTVNLGRIFQ